MASRVVSGPEDVRLFRDGWTFGTAADDVSRATFAGWMLDPVVASALGRAPTRFTPSETAQLLATHDGRTSWFLLIRTPERRLVGWCSVQVGTSNGVARVDMVVGDREVNPLAVQDATLRTVGQWLFGYQRIRKAVFHIRADNRMAVHWLSSVATLEGRLRAEIVLPGGAPCDQLRYGLLADEWDALADRLDAAEPRPVMRRRPRPSDGSRGVPFRRLPA